LKLTPSHLAVLEEPLRAGRLAGCVRSLVLGGEPLTASALRLWQAHAPGTRLFNHYGPTETTVGCVIHEVNELGEGAIPIGRPISNDKILILNRQLQPLPIGVVGHLYIGGEGVARGYLNRPELTAQKFIPDPYSSTPGARLYDSGDLGRWNRAGRVEFIGRRDNQVKIRGYRIELGEIEAQLRLNPRLKEVAVVAQERAAGKTLVAYVVVQPGADTAERALEGEAKRALVAALREDLSRRVPEYLMPASWVVLAALPLTANGKVDRRALPPIDAREDLGDYLPPSTDLECLLADLWRELLRVEKVGVTDSFFELGGHSLLAMQLVVRLRALLSIDLSLRVVFECPTLRDLCPQVEALRQARLVGSLTQGGKELEELLQQVADLPDSEVEQWMQALQGGQRV